MIDRRGNRVYEHEMDEARAQNLERMAGLLKHYFEWGRVAKVKLNGVPIEGPASITANARTGTDVRTGLQYRELEVAVYQYGENGATHHFQPTDIQIVLGGGDRWIEFKIDD